MSKVKTAYERYRTVFENHKNLLSFTATALSCMAAYLGYVQRMRHQQKLEEQLRELNQTISQEQQLHADISNFGKKTSDVSMIALFMASSALLGYSIGRFHGRRSAIKRFVSLTSPNQQTTTLSSIVTPGVTSSALETGSVMAGAAEIPSTTNNNKSDKSDDDETSFFDRFKKESRDENDKEESPDSNNNNNEKSSPVNPEPVPEVTRGSAKQKRTCDWETADANQLQFIANNPTVGKGGVDVVCKLDLSFEGNSMKRKFVADPSIESEMFLVEAEMSYDFIERGFFKIVRVVQQVDHVDLVVRMPRPTRETTTPQTIFFRILYNMKAILVNPQTKQQGKFTYEPIDKEELSNQATSKLLEFYQSYGSQFNDEVRRLIADKISNQIHNVTFDDMEGIHPKQYANLYVQFTELHYRVVTDESEMDEEEFINAVNSLGHESRDIYGFTLLTHYAFRGMKKHCRILMNRFGMSFENKDNLGVSVLEWCRLAHNPNNILELSYLEKSKTIPRHGIYTTSSPSIPIKQTKKDSTGSSPPNSTGTSPVRKSSWFSGIFRNIFTSPSQNQIYFDEDLTEEKESAQPLDMNVTSYDERLLSLEERQGMKLYLDKLKKLDEKISSKHGQGKSQEKSQAWKDLYLDENKTIEAQNAICKDRFVAKHYGKTMEHLSKKHKDERKPPLMTVKIIVSDCTNDFRNSLFDLFRPTYKDNLFGAFHTGLLIGPWRFDFYDHSIVRVRGDYRVYRNEYALAVIDVGSFSKVDNIKNALDTVASACVEWNATKTYDPFKCNCQHFVTDVLGRLNLWSDKPQTSPLSPFERYLEDLRKGRSERKFYFSDAIKSLKEQYPESSYWENDYITFNSRKELNDFCHWLDGMKYFENEESVSDIKLLKSFDRSFCMQSMNPEQEVSESDTSTVWFFSEDGTEFANSLNKLVFNLPGVTFPQALRV